MPWTALFDLSPESFPFGGAIPSQIEARRADLSDLLLFDVLLNGADVAATEFYPPHDPESLGNLLAAIDGCKLDQLKRDCLVYYLLKWHTDGRESLWVEERCIPAQFMIKMDAYWYLDKGIELPVRSCDSVLNHTPSPLLTS